MLILRIIRAALRLILFFLGSMKVTGRARVLPKGPYIIATNHMSKADPPLLLLSWPDINVRFFAGEKWEKHLIFGPLMRWSGAIYINRGEVDRKALQEAREALETGSIFGLAPEGKRSRVGELIEGKDGVAYLATRSNVPVIPVGLVNTDVLGNNIKRLRRTNLEVHIGHPINLPDLGRRVKSVDLSAYTHLIMIHIAVLLPERYWGYYADSSALRALLDGEDPWPYCLAEEGIKLEAT